MNPLLRSAIRELRTQHGVNLDALADLGHILTLKELADRVIRVQVDLRSEAVLRPVSRVGSIELRRLPIGAREFLTSQVRAWFSESSRWTAYSFAFCHAHVAEPGEVWGYEGRPKAWKARLVEWKRGLDCSEAELFQAVVDFQNEVDTLDRLLERINGPTPDTKGGKMHTKDEDEDDPGQGSYGPLIELLSSAYGSTVPPGMTAAEFWLWRVPMEEVELLATAYLDRVDRDERAKAAKEGKPIATDPDQTFIRAHRALKKYMHKIVEEKAA